MKHGTIELYCKPFCLSKDSLISELYDSMRDLSQLDVCYGDYWTFSLFLDSHKIFSTSLNSYSCLENVTYIQSVSTICGRDF